MDCQDTLGLIFQYLEGEDLLNCSKVCRSWYQASSKNPLWFECLRRQVPKSCVVKNDPRFVYRPRVCYKRFYLSFFRHQYEFTLYDSISKMWKLILEDPERNVFEKISAVGLFIPATLFIGVPIGLLIESIHCLDLKLRKRKYCSCQKCYQRQSLFIEHSLP